MRRTRVGRIQLFLGVVSAVLAILTLFVLPGEALYSNGRLHSSDLFRGLETLFGNGVARYFTALPFGVLGFVLVRGAFFQEEELSPEEQGSTSRKRRR